MDQLSAYAAAQGGEGEAAGVRDWAGGADAAALLQAADEMAGVAQPDVERHQQQYVRYSTMQEAHQLHDWRQQDSLMAEATSNFGDPSMVRQVSDAYPLSVSLRLVQAPAAFARPMVQRKIFRPSFKARLEVRWRGQLSLPVRVDVATLVDAQLAKPATWKPDQTPVQAEIESTRIIRHIQVPALEGPDRETGLSKERVHAEHFDFVDLRFIKSSRMSKRWLVFALRIKDDLIYTIYTLPTVIISRRTDQFAKALETLTGTPVAPPAGSQGGPAAKRQRTAQPQFPQSMPVPPALEQSPTGATHSPRQDQQLTQRQREQQQQYQQQPFQQQAAQRQYSEDAAKPAAAAVARLQPLPPPMDSSDEDSSDEGQNMGRPAAQPATADTVAGWVARRYAGAGLTRRLAAADMAALEAAAGLPASRRGGGRLATGAAAAAQPDDWLAFKDWFGRAVRLLAATGLLWNVTDPVCIAGFAIDRSAAERILAEQPQGTFLLRLAEEAGSFAISLRTGAAAANCGLSGLSGVAHAGGGGGLNPKGDGAGVAHALIDGGALAGMQLPAHVLAHPAAWQLLDLASGRLLPKEDVFSSPGQLADGRLSAAAARALRHAQQLTALAATGSPRGSAPMAQPPPPFLRFSSGGSNYGGSGAPDAAGFAAASLPFSAGLAVSMAAAMPGFGGSAFSAASGTLPGGGGASLESLHAAVAAAATAAHAAQRQRDADAANRAPNDPPRGFEWGGGTFSQGAGANPALAPAAVGRPSSPSLPPRRPLPRRLQPAQVPACLGDGDAPPGFAGPGGHCC